MMKKNYLLLFTLFLSYTIHAQDIMIHFEETQVVLSENSGTTPIAISISETANVTASISVILTNDESESFTIENSVTFVSGESTVQGIDLTVINNDIQNKDYFITLSIQDPTGAILGEDTVQTIYVIDDEAHAPEAQNSLEIQLSDTIEVNGAEIVTYDKESARLFVSNSGDTAVEILDFSDPTDITFISSIILENFGDEVTSVSALDGIVAVALKGEDQENGTVVFIDTEGNILSSVTVGSLPDMLTFTPDGTKVVVANEGEPNDEYTIDPEGAIAIIDMTNGVANLTNDNVTLLNFNAFDSGIETLRTAGVRIFGPNASVSQDLEPEFVAISDDGTTAYVSLQENNAYAIVNLETETIEAIIPYGFKDHNIERNAFDASNDLDFVFISSWKTLGMYQPDAIAYYSVNEVAYLVIANEGDARDYDGFSEEVRVRDLTLDPIAYPNAAIIQEDENLGRLNATTATGDTDGDGDIDQIYSYGGRSFSIINAATGAQVYDSGDLLERITSEDPVYGAIFNATDDENNFKNRSDDKGPEPEAVTLANIDEQWYAFVGLERIGGVAVFNITDPQNPTFERYVNNRDVTPGVENPAGDLAPEGIIYIAPEDNPSGIGYMVVANEVSSTITAYAISNDTLSLDDNPTLQNEITLFPNPVQDGFITFSQVTSYQIIDLQGRLITSGKETITAPISTLKPGIYIISFENGTSQKLIKR